jgi:ubiquinone/menaquinone biosynthesis C-methylase UbiE
MTTKRGARFYEGSFYAGFMDRFQAGLHALVSKHVEPGLRILDVGCGTGNLTLKLASQSAEIVGVDISEAMLGTARKRARRGAFDNVRFVEADIAAGLTDEGDDAFDLALSVMVVHEMPHDVRVAALREMARVAPRVLIVDFEAPQLWNAAGVRNRTFEMLAGRQHYLAFRDYQARGGMPAITEDAKLELDKLRSVDAKTLGIFELRRHG